MDAEILNAGQCLRCKAQLYKGAQFLQVMESHERFTFSVCLDCWNELIWNDAIQREVDVSTVLPDGRVETLRPW
jgi:hypothetical protein